MSASSRRCTRRWVGAKLRDRSRSVKHRLLEIGRVARGKAVPNRERLQRAYGRLLDATGRVVGQARRFSREIGAGVKHCTEIVEQAVLNSLRQALDDMIPLVCQVMRQTRVRIFGGDTHSEGKLVSLFEPSTEVIRKGKAGKPTEFGKLVKLQETENQIVVDYEVYARRPNDVDLLIPAIEAHRAALGRVPRLVAGDAAFYSAKNEAAAQAMGVKRVCVPSRSTKNAERKREQKKRWLARGNQGEKATTIRMRMRRRGRPKEGRSPTGGPSPSGRRFCSRLAAGGWQGGDSSRP